VSIKWGQIKVANSEIKRRSVSTAPLDEVYSGFELSKTTVTRLAQLHVAFIRHVGPYESVTDALWHRLEDWAKSKRLSRDLIFLGIAHDAPGRRRGLPHEARRCLARYESY
jgi:GyrI-like small molecule binding protein